jgi:hypothetical protein
MDLNLRKARKLEAKIQKAADALSLSQAIKVRALASPEERALALSKARDEYNAALKNQKELIMARFSIRDAIADANARSGINSLMAQRELVQALLAKSTAGVDSLDLAEAEDRANAKKKSLEGGENNSYGETSVTITLPVSSKEDVESFKKSDQALKKQLEDIEDELSQKNLGSAITLSDENVSLLQVNGLL